MKKQILAVSAVLGIAALILSAGTLAYFTDRTETITNTFTVGKVNIELTEEEKDAWGLNDDDTAKTILMPGKTYKKTPIITVQDDSQDAYVFAAIQLDHGFDYVKAVLNYMVQLGEENGGITRERADSLLNTFQNNPNIFNAVGNSNIFGTLLSQFIDGFDTDKWSVISSQYDAATETATFIVAATDGFHTAGDELTLFTGIKVPAELSTEVFANTNFDLAHILVTAAAIQAEGFDNYEAAAAALAAQWNISLE